MRRRIVRKLRIQGINTEDINNTLANGTCVELNNLFPTGNPQNPNWKPVAPPETIGTFSSSDLNSSTDTIYDMLVQSRDAAGNLVIYVLFEDASANTYELAKYIKSGVDYAQDTLIWSKSNTEIVTLDGILKFINDGQDIFYLTEAKQSSTDDDYQAWAAIYNGSKSLPTWVHRGHYNTIFQPTSDTYSDADFDENFPTLDLHPGYDITKVERYVGYITAVKLPDDTYVLHSMPFIAKFDDTAGSTDKTLGYVNLVKDTGYSTIYNHTDLFDDESGGALLSSHILGEFNAPVTSFTDYGLRDQPVYVFSTIAHKTYGEALQDGSYFLQGEWDSFDPTTFSGDKAIQKNALILATSEVLNVDPLSYHFFSGRNIGVYRNLAVLSGVITDFSLPGYDWHGNAWWQSSDLTSPSGWEAVDGVVRVKITVDGVDYYRSSAMSFPRLTSSAESWYHYGLFTYPDRRATALYVYVKDSGGNWKDVIDGATMVRHPSMNMSYYLDTEVSIAPSGNPLPKDTSASGAYTSWASVADVTSGTSTIAQSTIDSYFQTENKVCLHEPNKVKISSLFQQHFPLEQTYEFDDEVIATFDNTGSVSEGQFGSYPFYVFCRNKIYGMESSQTGGLFSREVEISSQLGVTSPKAFTVMDGALFFVSTRGIHVLTSDGNIENIHYALQEGTSWDFDMFIGQNKVWQVYGDKHEDKVYFTPPFDPNSRLTFIYDTRYGFWYTRTRLRNLQRRNGFLYGLGGDTGLVWSSVSAPEANSWQDVCWSPSLGMFAAVAGSGSNRVMTSTDGATWVSAAAPEANDYKSIAWSETLGMFAAISDDGTNRVMTSTDGSTWTAGAAAEANSWEDIVATNDPTPSNAQFVAVSDSGTNRVMLSTNGVLWTSASAAEANGWNAITYSQDKDLLVAVATTGTNRVMISSNGSSWTAYPAAEDNAWQDITYSPKLGRFVAVASTSGSSRVMTSEDGQTWTSRSSSDDSLNWLKVVWAEELELFVAVASGGTQRVMTSEDGITWAGQDQAEDNQWASVTWAPALGLFAAVSVGGTNRIMTSPYGVTESLSDSNKIYDMSVSSTSDTSSQAITLTTNEFHIDDEVQYKRLKTAIFKGVFKGGSTDLVVTLQGKRKSTSAYIDLTKLTITDGNEYEDLIMQSYGSMQSYRLTITGKARHAESLFQEIVLNYSPRGKDIKT